MIYFLIFHFVFSLGHCKDILFKDYSAEHFLNFTHDHGGSGEYFYVESMGSGICLIDYDNDGDLDAYFPQGAPLPGWEKDKILENKLYRNDGANWVDVTQNAGVGDKSYSMGCACADFDNDGDTDLYVTNFGHDVFYLNEGDGTFKDVTKELGIENKEMGASAAFFDSDEDGWLDLYVTNYVQYSTDENPECIGRMHTPDHGKTHVRSYCDPDNFFGEADKFFYNNKGIFIDRSSRSGINRVQYKGLGVVPGDVDNDGDMDIYVANDKEMNLLFINNGKGRFVEKALAMGVGYNGDGLAEAGMGVDFGDYNRDGWLDIFVTHFTGETNTLYENQGLGYFTDASMETGLGKPSIPFLAFGTKFIDLNLDGWLDIFVANGHVIDNINLINKKYQHAQHNQVYMNKKNSSFEDKTYDIGGDLTQKAVSRGSAFGDIDNDGDIDYIVSNNNQSASLMYNVGDPSNNWIGIELEGVDCNRDAIGTKLTLISKSGTQIAWINPASSYLTSNDKRIVFGIEKDNKIVSLEISWFGSNTQTLRNMEPNYYYKIIQNEVPKKIEYKFQQSF